jgi:hypothetical protein
MRIVFKKRIMAAGELTIVLYSELRQMLLKFLYRVREDIEECPLREEDTGSSVYVEQPQRLGVLWWISLLIVRVERGKVYIVLGKEIWEGPYVGMVDSCFSVRRR